MKTTESALTTNSRKALFIAFATGAFVHAALLALSLSEMFAFATWFLLVFALPGAIVDMSAEVIHPSQAGAIVLAIAGSVVNGAAYYVMVWIVLTIQKRPRKKSDSTKLPGK